MCAFWGLQFCLRDQHIILMQTVRAEASRQRFNTKEFKPTQTGRKQWLRTWQSPFTYSPKALLSAVLKAPEVTTALSIGLKRRISTALRTEERVSEQQTHSAENSGNRYSTVETRQLWFSSHHYLEPQIHQLPLSIHIAPIFLGWTQEGHPGWLRHRSTAPGNRGSIGSIGSDFYCPQHPSMTVLSWDQGNLVTEEKKTLLRYATTMPEDKQYKRK